MTNRSLTDLLAGGKIESMEDAQLFADHADFFENDGNWKHESKTAGDFRIDTPEGFYEIYGIIQNTGEDEKMPVPYAPQNIRFYKL